jgi:hypothetical protein
MPPTTPSREKRRVRFCSLIQIGAFLLGVAAFFVGVEWDWSGTDTMLFICCVLMTGPAALSFWTMMGFQDHGIEFEGWIVLWGLLSIVLGVLGLYFLSMFTLPVPD